LHRDLLLAEELLKYIVFAKRTNIKLNEVKIIEK